MRTSSPELSPALARAARLVLLLFIVSLPVLSWAIEVGVALTASHLLGLAVIALSLRAWWETRRRPTLDLASVCLLAYMALSTITVLLVWSRPDTVILGESLHAKAAKQLVGLCFAVGLFLGLRYLLEATGLWIESLRAYYVTAVVVGVLSLAQYGAAVWDLNSVVANFPVHNSSLGITRNLITGNARYGFPRVSFTLVEPSRLSMYLLTGWALWAYGMTWPAPRRAGRWATASGVVLGTALLVAGARSGYLVMALLAAVASVVRPNRIRRMALIAASAVIAALLVRPANAAKVTATLLPDNAKAMLGDAVSPPPSPAGGGGARCLSCAVERRLIAMGTHSDRSVRHRIGSALVVLYSLRAHPWLGEGYGTSEFAMAAHYPEQMGPIWFGSPTRPSLLSTYGAILAETGVFGGLLILGLMVGVFGAVYRVARRQGRDDIAWALAGGLAAYGIIAIGRSIEPYQFLVIWFLQAVALAAASEARPEVVRRRPPIPLAMNRQARGDSRICG